MKAKHLKTGRIYYVMPDKVINCTNEVPDEKCKMVMYCNPDIPNTVFVRDYDEFYEKFEIIDPPSTGTSIA